MGPNMNSETALLNKSTSDGHSYTKYVFSCLNLLHLVSVLLDAVYCDLFNVEDFMSRMHWVSLSTAV